MLVTGEATFISVKKGVSKRSGSEYFAAKFLDEDAEEFITFFVDQEFYKSLEKLLKNTPVLLTINLALTSKYFSLVSVEPLTTEN